MQLLLDTHAFIWFANGDSQLPQSVRELIADVNNECFLSIASLWEITIKHSQGKLDLGMSFEELFAKAIDNDIIVLTIQFEHLQTLLPLPYHHRDPFDRIIISQAITEKLTIITKDEHFPAYRVDLRWK